MPITRSDYIVLLTKMGIIIGFIEQSAISGMKLQTESTILRKMKASRKVRSA